MCKQQFWSVGRAHHTLRIDTARASRPMKHTMRICAGWLTDIDFGFGGASCGGFDHWFDQWCVFVCIVLWAGGCGLARCCLNYKLSKVLSSCVVAIAAGLRWLVPTGFTIEVYISCRHRIALGDEHTHSLTDNCDQACCSCFVCRSNLPVEATPRPACVQHCTRTRSTRAPMVPLLVSYNAFPQRWKPGMHRLWPTGHAMKRGAGVVADQ